MKNSRYNPIHALAATALWAWLMFSSGFDTFWKLFVHGLSQPLNPNTLPMQLLQQNLFNVTVLLALWGSTFIPRLFRVHPRSEPSVKPRRLQAVLFALKLAVPIIVVAMGLGMLGAKIIEMGFGVKPADQELVKCFLDPAFTPWHKVAMIFSVTVLAPVFEELMFRGIIFRGFASKMPVGLAMVLSGFIFSVAHVNAASLLAVWFLGVAFAWTYARTHTIWASITLHSAFNSLNVVLLVFFPELAAL